MQSLVTKACDLGFKNMIVKIPLQSTNLKQESILKMCVFAWKWYLSHKLMFMLSFSLVADENPDEVYFQELPVWKREYFW